MATNILMPALSPTMTEGTLARWLKKEGDTVTAGDVIAEIETDKATMEVEAVDEGVLGKILVADGTAGVQVNAPIAILVEAGEAVPSGGAPRRRRPRLRRRRRTARRSRPPPARPWPRRRRPPGAGRQRPRSRRRRGGRVFASPLARRMAKQAGIALDGIRAAARTAASSRPISRLPRRRPAPAGRDSPRPPVPAAPAAPAPRRRAAARW